MKSSHINIAYCQPFSVKRIILVTFLFLIMILTACSRQDGNDEENQSFVPRPIPSEYTGLSLQELKAQSTMPKYSDLTDNIDEYKGTLVWLMGKVAIVFEGTQANTYQIYVNINHITEVAGTKVDKWRDPVLILHSKERGPEIKVGDKIQFASTVLSVLPGTGVFRQQDVVPTNVDRPVLNLIKLEIVTDESD